MARQTIRGGMLWCALVVALLVAGGCEQTRRDPVLEQGANAYVGSAACRECHGDIFSGWKGTFHAYKFQRATPEFVIGDFTRDNRFENNGNTAVMSREGDRFFIASGDSGVELRRYPVKYAVGSIWKQRYITEFPNGGLHVLPVQWNVRTREWTGYDLLEHGTDTEDVRMWMNPEQSFQYRCLGCHTTNPSVNYDADADAFQTKWTDLGVGCEACHGPGKRHIEAEILDKIDTILSPNRLADPERAAMICGSCHTRGVTPDGVYAYPVSYRPGALVTFRFDEAPAVHPDGSPKQHHQQYLDWKRSGHARSGVMCWDCHSPHATGKSNRFQLKLPGSLLCTSCHAVKNQGVHGLHSTSNCIGCHMPSTVHSATPADLRSHSMRVVRPILTAEAEEPELQPNSCTHCHYHRDTDPDSLVHMMEAVQKPQPCMRCHGEDELEW